MSFVRGRLCLKAKKEGKGEINHRECRQTASHFKTIREAVDFISI